VTGVPMLFMLISTVVAMIANLKRFWGQWSEGGSALFIIGAVLLVLTVWLCFEAVLRFRQVRSEETLSSMSIDLPGKGA